MIQSYRDLTWEQHGAIDKSNAYAMLPIASIEQHGPHMPVGTDDYIIEYVLKRLTGDPQIKKEIYVMPPLHYGLSPEHMSKPGTITLSSGTIISMIDDIMKSLSIHGWKKIVILNSHGGNKSLLHGLAQEWKWKSGMDVYVIDTCSPFYDDLADTVMDTPASLEVHAGEDETSQILYEYPRLVHMEVLQSGFSGVVHRLPKERDSWYTTEVDPSGIIGAAHLATAQKGEKLTNMVCQCVVDRLNSLED